MAQSLVIVLALFMFANGSFGQWVPNFTQWSKEENRPSLFTSHQSEATDATEIVRTLEPSTFRKDSMEEKSPSLAESVISHSPAVNMPTMADARWSGPVTLSQSIPLALISLGCAHRMSKIEATL